MVQSISPQRAAIICYKQGGWKVGWRFIIGGGSCIKLSQSVGLLASGSIVAVPFYLQ